MVSAMSFYIALAFSCNPLLGRKIQWYTTAASPMNPTIPSVGR